MAVTAPLQVVLLNDVDFIVSGGLTTPEQHAAVIGRVQAKQALVLPALEPLETVVGIKRGINQTLEAARGVGLSPPPFRIHSLSGGQKAKDRRDTLCILCMVQLYPPPAIQSR